jgi:hypothetical protein
MNGYTFGGRNIIRRNDFFRISIPDYNESHHYYVADIYNDSSNPTTYKKFQECIKMGPRIRNYQASCVRLFFQRDEAVNFIGIIHVS